MPVFDVLSSASPADRSSDLKRFGPLILVEIGLPVAVEQEFIKLRRTVPEPRVGYAIIDTGASASAVDESIFLHLGVSPIDSIYSYSSFGEQRALVYPGKVSFPALAVQGLPMERLVGCKLISKILGEAESPWRAQDGTEIIMLIGRDLLAGMLIVYNGLTGTVTLGF
jgi:hypothetical protein